MASLDEFVTLEASKIPNQLEIAKKCLIGKLFSDKPQVHATITTVLYDMWNKPKGFICEEVEDRIYRFYFDDEFDANMKLRRQPWYFKGQLLVLRRWEKKQGLAAYNFDRVPFTIQVWGLPSKFCTTTICKKLCSQAGSVHEEGIYFVDDSCGFLPKAVVHIDVSKPLTPGAYLDTDDCGKIWVNFKYEKLPMFCYYCGKIGHEERGCLDLTNDEMKNNVQSYKYGPNLKVDHLGKTRIDRFDEEQNKKYCHQNQRSIIKKRNKSMVDEVSQHLSSLYVTKKQHGIDKDQNLNPSPQFQMEKPNTPILTVDNLQLDLLKFNLGCDTTPSPKTKNKANIMSSHKAHPYPSSSTLVPGPIDQARHEYQSTKRRIVEINEHKKGKRVCMELS